MFGDFDFSKMNETDVRENIIAPLLRELGYRHSTSADVITEQSLRYPRIHLGRKKKGDPLLRGKADYILEVDRRLRWVAEVKSPLASIEPDDRDQAWSYAAHSEVKGIFYLVTDGKIFELYQTCDAPPAQPLVTMRYEDLREKLHLLSNVLSPDSMRRDFKAFVLDSGKPLGIGLRSFAKVTSGSLTYLSITPPLIGAEIVGLTNYIKEGSVERSEGQILAYLKIGSSRRQIDEFNRALGLEVFELSTGDALISIDAEKPTCFMSNLNWTVPRGTLVPGLAGGQAVVLPWDMTIESKTTALGVLNGTRFSGSFEIMMKTSILPQTFCTKGEFDVTIS